MARLRLVAQEALADRGPYGRSDDCSGREIRGPMNGQGDADADIERVGDRDIPPPPLFRNEREHRDGHCERDGGMRGRPAPENPAAQEAEAENVAQIRACAVRGMDTAGNRLACGSDETADEFSPPDSPASQSGLSPSADAADGEQDQFCPSPFGFLSSDWYYL